MSECAVRFESGKTCFVWQKTITLCGDVYRNPGGTRLKENEFIWSSGDQVFTFSPAE
jgi:hypothetical protein